MLLYIFRHIYGEADATGAHVVLHLCVCVYIYIYIFRHIYGEADAAGAHVVLYIDIYMGRQMLLYI